MNKSLDQLETVCGPDLSVIAGLRVREEEGQGEREGEEKGEGTHLKLERMKKKVPGRRLEWWRDLSQKHSKSSQVHFILPFLYSAYTVSKLV